jgi:hypothetical protein
MYITMRIDIDECIKTTCAVSDIQTPYTANLYRAEKSAETPEIYFLMYVNSSSVQSARSSVAGVLLDENNDPVNMGTYNYSDPNATLAVGHVIVDVFPYSNEFGYQLISQLLGNSITGLGNVPGTYIDCSGANANFDRYDHNTDAQEHYARYK